MKVVTVSTFFLLVYGSKSQRILENTRRSSNLLEAVWEVVENDLAKYAENVNLISPSAETFEMTDFVSNFLDKISKNFKISVRYETIKTSNKFQSNIIRKKRSIIIIADTVENLFGIIMKISPKVFKLNGHYLIVLIDGKLQDMQKIFSFLWFQKLTNVNIIYENENGAILVETFMPFQSGQCDNTEPVLIASFKNGKVVQRTKDFFPKKLKNLHNCEIRVRTAVSEPYVIAKLLPNLTYELKGIDISLMKSLAESFNFKINISFKLESGYLYENGSASGNFLSLMNNQTDFIFNGFTLSSLRIRYFDSSVSYISDSVTFVVPPGSHLTSFEQLVNPFELSFWIVILVCFITGISVILTLKQFSQKVQNFVFGSNVKNSIFNMFETWMTGQQHILPRRNFARYLLMMFMIYSFVIRSLYQGAYFKLLRSNRNHKEVQTINEMIENDFKFYSIPAYMGYTEGSKAIDER